MNMETETDSRFQETPEHLRVITIPSPCGDCVGKNCRTCTKDTEEKERSKCPQCGKMTVEEGVMPEDGADYPIHHCTDSKCGWWGS